MTDFNDTMVAQSFPPPAHRSSRASGSTRDPPRRLDRSRERYPRGSLSPEFVDLDEKTRRRPSDIPSPEQRSPNLRSPSVRPAVRYDEVTRRVSTYKSDPKSTRPPMRYDQVIRRTRRMSSPSSSSEGRKEVRFEDDDGYSSSDTDSDYRGRQIARRPKPEQHQVKKRVPCSESCADHPHRINSQRKATKDVDDAYLSPDELFEKEAQARNKKLLYTGLACVATIAAGNNIYQNTKAHHLRKKEVNEGEMCLSEEKRLRQKALLMDILSVGVVAVGINNVRMGWKRVEGMK